MTPDGAATIVYLLGWRIQLAKLNTNRITKHFRNEIVKQGSGPNLLDAKLVPDLLE